MASWRPAVFWPFFDYLWQDIAWGRVSFTAPQAWWMWSDLRRRFPGGCYRRRPQGGSTPHAPGGFLWQPESRNSRDPGLELGVGNARAPVSLLLPTSLHLPDKSQVLLRQWCWGCCSSSMGALFKALSGSSVQNPLSTVGLLELYTGGPAWTWRLGTRHSTSKEGSLAGTSSTAPTQPRSSPSLGPNAAQAPGMGPRPGEACHWRFFSVVFSLKLFFTVYWNRVNLQCGVGFACWALCSVTWIHARICIFQFLSHLGY